MTIYSGDYTLEEREYPDILSTIGHKFYLDNDTWRRELILLWSPVRAGSHGE